MRCTSIRIPVCDSSIQLTVYNFTYSFFSLDIMDDPSVPTRERIKALSAKLVELNLQEDI